MLRFMRTPIAHRCIGQRLSSCWAPVANRASGPRRAWQSEGIGCGAHRTILPSWAQRPQPVGPCHFSDPGLSRPSRG